MHVTMTLNPAVDVTWQVRDVLRIGAVHAVGQETRTPGGKGLNVAKMLAAQGREVVAGGLVGQNQADWFSSMLRSMGVTPRLLSVDHDTRTNVMVTGADGREMKFNQSGFPDLEPDWPCLQKYLQSLVSGCSVAVFSGSLPARFPSDTYARIMEPFLKAGCAVALDTAGEALVLAARHPGLILKPNRDELSGWIGQPLTDDASLISAVRALSARHEIVMVSDGSVGAYFAQGRTVWLARAPDVRAVDTTGAGDALLGQFCSDYFPDRKLTEACMARAVAAGAAACEQYGTPLPDIARIAELSAYVSVERVASD